MKNGFNWPLGSNVIRRGSNNNTFGMVRSNADGSPRPHQGWDLYAPPGTPVHAVAGGKVVSATTRGDYGTQVEIRHEGGLFSFYAHLSELNCVVGDEVKCGDKIGLSGNSGNASTMTGQDQHLHFEMRTVQSPGRGLEGRISPMTVFDVCPLKDPIIR